MRLAILIALAFAAAAPAPAQQPDPGRPGPGQPGAEQGGTGGAPGGPPSAPPNREPPPAASPGCTDPTFGGKYAEELRRIAVPQDLARYGRCRDYGAWSGSSYEGYTNLPNGFWVYSYPQWIIFARRSPR